uniref:Spectrin alpha chain-like protein n=1 Tax=Panagrolaimus sp. JU765 TaxID=591449 RepID=A0AC34Q791_9BILA
SHDEKKIEIDGHESELKNLSEYGQRIATEQPDHKAEINRHHRRLQNIEHQIRQTWEAEKVTLTKLWKLQLLNQQVTLAESWIASKEAIINQFDAGESIDAVDSLIKKHDVFEKTIKSQGKDKIDQLKQDATILDEIRDHEAEFVRNRYEEVLTRYQNLIENSHLKRKKLDDSRELHDFIRSCGELITWMNTQLQLAYDNDYIDPTNLRSKLQEQLASEAELVANETRIDDIKKTGEKLISTNIFERERVKMQLNEVLTGWEELKSKSARKTKLLKDSYEAYQLSRKLDEIDKW